MSTAHEGISVKTPVRFCFFLLTVAHLLPVIAISQERQLLILSPRVGPVIDSAKASTFSLFRSIDNFHSASFYQEHDSSFSVVVSLSSPDGFFYDSSFVVSNQIVRLTAERIDHWEELLENKYKLGSSEPRILYDDKTQLVPPTDSVTTKRRLLHQASVGELPLAPNTSGLARPSFQTMHLDVSVGMGAINLPAIESLTNSPSNIIVPVKIALDVPVMEDPGISIVVGWGAALGGAGGGDLESFSALALYRPATGAFPLKPIIGFGGERRWYDFSGNVIINATQTYFHVHVRALCSCEPCRCDADLAALGRYDHDVRNEIIHD